MRRNNGYLLGQIGNADQTPLYFDMPGTTTVEKKGAKQVRVLTSVHGKTTVTAMLCYTSDGHKLRPYLIFKWKTLPKGVVFSSGVIVRASEKNGCALQSMSYVFFFFRGGNRVRVTIEGAVESSKYGNTASQFL